jgi:hypothetical protein
LSTALLLSGIKPRGVYKIDYKCSQTRVTIFSIYSSQPNSLAQWLKGGNGKEWAKLASCQHFLPL